MLTNESKKNALLEISTLVHFTRLGYEYTSLKNLSKSDMDMDTNIHIPTFCKALNRINNTELTEIDVRNLVDYLKDVLNAKDLGRNFYSILVNGCSGLKLLDLETVDGCLNTYQVVGSLVCKNGFDSFCSDVSVLINGLPLSFIRLIYDTSKRHLEEEFEQIKTQGKNISLRRYVNMTQILLFSNNKAYDNTGKHPLNGSFYATTSYNSFLFNRFVEEDDLILRNLPKINRSIESYILSDKRSEYLESSAEYKSCLNPLSPTNKIITSIFSKERLVFILKHAILYTEKSFGTGYISLKKYIMRYPQLFAAKAIIETVNQNIKKGIVLHSPGSGKTTLAAYVVRYFDNYYKKKDIVPQFYYFVDREDLALLAVNFFSGYGYYAVKISDKDDFAKKITSTYSTASLGFPAVIVVNIQDFDIDILVKKADFKENVQRFYFLDEVHRSYINAGSFLQTLLLLESDAVKITLTGTPLKGFSFDTKNTYVRKKVYEPHEIFGNYIHQYAYNKSISDGYTLDLLYENIPSSDKKRLEKNLTTVAEKKVASEAELFSSHEYLTELLQFILKDFSKAKKKLKDDTIGAIIICQSTEQARLLFEEMQDIEYTSALLLKEVGTPDSRKTLRSYFKQGRLDFLVTYDMVLAGFNMPRLKKIYVGRKISDYSLMQALTKANRPYGAHRFGYIMDFADVQDNSHESNKDIFDEFCSVPLENIST